MFFLRVEACARLGRSTSFIKLLGNLSPNDISRKPESGPRRHLDGEAGHVDLTAGSFVRRLREWGLPWGWQVKVRGFVSMVTVTERGRAGFHVLPKRFSFSRRTSGIPSRRPAR